MANIKIIKKSKCHMQNGYVCKKNKIIGMPEEVVLQANMLEEMAQQWGYLKRQPNYVPAPSLDGFVRESIDDGALPYRDNPDTPTMDARVAESMAFMDEVDMVENKVQTNIMIDKFADLISWCDSDSFVSGDCFKRIDTPYIGNILELTGNTIAILLERMVSDPAVSLASKECLEAKGIDVDGDLCVE